MNHESQIVVEELVPPPDPVRCCELVDGLSYRLFLDSASRDARLGRHSFLGLEALLAAEEAFLTSSLRGLAPLVRVGSQVIGRGSPGPYTVGLTAAYAALVDRECGT